MQLDINPHIEIAFERICKGVLFVGGGTESFSEFGQRIENQLQFLEDGEDYVLWVLPFSEAEEIRELAEEA